MRLALVQSDLGAAEHVGVRGPVEHEQRAFDPADFPQGGRQLVLPGIRGELAQDLARPHGPGGHGGGDAQDVSPVPVDQVHVHLTADQWPQALRDAALVRDLRHLAAAGALFCAIGGQSTTKRKVVKPTKLTVPPKTLSQRHTTRTSRAPTRKDYLRQAVCRAYVGLGIVPTPPAFSHRPQ